MFTCTYKLRRTYKLRVANGYDDFDSDATRTTAADTQNMNAMRRNPKPTPSPIRPLLQPLCFSMFMNL